MLEVDYQSITRDEPTRRMISPHALGYDGVRWHVRAYCHLRNAFHDFVIGRITKVGHAKSTLIRALDDQDWHEKVDLVLAPHPALSTQQKRGVEIDYKMIDGRTKLTSRRAMLYYTLRRLGIRDDGTPQDYPKQVVIENLEEVRPFLQFDLSRRK